MIRATHRPLSVSFGRHFSSRPPKKPPSPKPTNNNEPQPNDILYSTRTVRISGLPNTGYTISSVLDQVVTPNSSGALLRVEHPEPDNKVLEVAWIDWVAARRFMDRRGASQSLEYVDTAGKRHPLTVKFAEGRAMSSVTIANIGLRSITRVLRVQGFPSVDDLKSLKDGVTKGRYFLQVNAMTRNAINAVCPPSMKWTAQPVDRIISDEENLRLDIHCCSVYESEWLRTILENFSQLAAIPSSLRLEFLPDPCSGGGVGVTYDDDPNYTQHLPPDGRMYRNPMPVEGEPSYITINRRLLVLGDWKYLQDFSGLRNFIIQTSLVRGVVGLTFSHKEAAMDFYVSQQKHQETITGAFSLVWGNPVHVPGSLVLASHIGASTTVVFRGIRCPRKYLHYYNNKGSERLAPTFSHYGSVLSIKLFGTRVDVSMKSLRSALRIVRQPAQALQLAAWRDLQAERILEIGQVISVGFPSLGRPGAFAQMPIELPHVAAAKEAFKTKHRPRFSKSASVSMVAPVVYRTEDSGEKSR